MATAAVEQSNEAIKSDNDPSDEFFGSNTTCLICCSDDLSRNRGITPCNHNNVCGICHTRLRYLHSDLRCPICKSSNDRVIVDEDTATGGGSVHKLFEDFSIWGDDDLGQDFIMRDEVKMFFRHEYHKTDIMPLFRLGCNIKKCGYIGKNMKGLKDHLRVKHTTTFCDLCVEAKRDFISKLPRFRPEQLKYHQSKGEGKGSGFTGHPLCEFCRPKRFYDLTKLHEHLNKEHYKCHVCERQGLHNQFFKNYDKLALHFDKQHFLCHHPQCLEARFVVFDNEIDLRAHEVSTHGGSLNSNSSTKIQLDFRVRRSNYDGAGYIDQTPPTEDDFQYGLNGEAFVPDSLPEDRPNAVQENEPEISDPVHAARTAEMRTQAAQIRQQQQQQQQSSSRGEEFPELGPANGGGQQLVGWSGDIVRSGRRNISSQEEFPSLSSTVNPSLHAKARQVTRKGMNVKKKVAVVPSRQFATIATTPLVKSQAPLSKTTQNTIATRHQTTDLSAENFPSLGGSTARAATMSKPYAAAHNYYKKIQTSQSKASAIIQTASTPAKKPPPKPPTADDFPGLVGSAPAYSAAQSYVKKQALAKKYALLPTEASKMEPKEQISALKSLLGSANYKRLKCLTRDFAMDQCAYEQYVDQVATCFTEGKDDDDFWNFVPALIQSCPENSDGRNHRAIQYMTKIRMAMVDTESNISAYAVSSDHAMPSISAGSRSFVPTANQSVTPSQTKKSPIWGTGTSLNKTSNILAHSKLPPGISVAKAASEQMTETKIKQQPKSVVGQGKKSKQKQKKKELKNLAFGGS